MPQVVVVIGVTGTGKSTVARALAERLDWHFAEGDDMHSPASVDKMRSGRPLTDDDRRPWLQRIADWIGERESAGADAVVTCSALKRSYRDLLSAGHPTVRFCHLTASRGLLEQRLRLRRGHYMPASQLGDQLATLEPLEPDERGFTVSDNGTAAEVVARVLAVLAT